MDGQISISRTLDNDALEIRMIINITNHDMLDGHLSGDALLALEKAMLVTESFHMKLACLVAIIATVQDRHMNPILQLKKIDCVIPKKR